MPEILQVILGQELSKPWVRARTGCLMSPGSPGRPGVAAVHLEKVTTSLSSSAAHGAQPHHLCVNAHICAQKYAQICAQLCMRLCALARVGPSFRARVSAHVCPHCMCAYVCACVEMQPGRAGPNL